jgi:hypothetical protein
VRTILLSFRRAVLPLCQQAPPAGELASVVRQVKEHTTHLVQDAYYYQVRAPDRYALQHIDARLSVYLNNLLTAATPPDSTDAWAALLALQQFAQKLLGVNQRPLLVQHDQKLCKKLLTALATLAPLASSSHTAAYQTQLLALWHDAAMLGWRSPSLEALLQNAPPLSERAGRLAAALNRLQAEMHTP